MTIELTTPAIDVGLITSNLAGQTRFYGEVLGLAASGSVEIPHVGTITRFAAGQSTLRLMVPEKAPASPARDGGFVGTVGIGYIALRIANLAEMVKRVEDAGFVIAIPIRTLRPGVEVALVEDADGNTVELMQESAS
ncbi:MAG: VOC family protein [Blastomonas sp.]